METTKQKIIIISPENIDPLKVGIELINIDDELNISIYTSNNKDICNEFIIYMDLQNIYKCFQNNAFLYINKDGEDYFGITMDEFYNSDISCMHISDFNKIPERVFKEYEILLIWLDTKDTSNNLSLFNDINEIKFLDEKLNNINYMYFLDEDFGDVANIVLRYLNSDEQTQYKILQENS